MPVIKYTDTDGTTKKLGLIVPMDAALDATSENGVQNKVIKAAIDGKSTVTGTSDGTNWQTITIDGVMRAIPTGGGGGGSGTVTSVSAGTGLSISGTATINPTVNIASGYKLPTTSEWNGKQNTITFNTAYDASTNKAATMADINNVVGNINTILDTINGEVI